VPGLLAADMTLYATAARWRSGQVEGGSAGTTLRAEAAAWLQQLPAVRPSPTSDR